MANEITNAQAPNEVHTNNEQMNEEQKGESEDQSKGRAESMEPMNMYKFLMK